MDTVVDPKQLLVVDYVPEGTKYGECDHIIVPFDNSIYGNPLKVTCTDGVYTISIDEDALQKQKINANTAYRDTCLQKSDFTMLPDTGLLNVDEWKTFRSTLRTLSMNPPVSWPEEPSSPWGPFLPTPPSN